MSTMHEAPNTMTSKGVVGLARWLRALAIVATPVFLVALTVTAAFNTTALYRLGFRMNNVSVSTGISDGELARVAREMRSYFNSSQEYLETRVRIGETDQPLFNQRELVHMKDVKDVVRRVYLIGFLTGAYLLAFIAVGFWRHGGAFRGVVGSVLVTSGIATVGFALAVGVTFLVAFDAVFTLFHKLSFANDFWQLDPRTDYLVRLFPFPFWSFSATLVAVAVVTEAAGLTALGAWLRRSMPSKAQGR